METRFSGPSRTNGRRGHKLVRMSMLGALALLLLFATTALASRQMNYKGTGIDDEKVTVVFTLHIFWKNDVRHFELRDIEARNAKCVAANGFAFRSDFGFGWLEPVRVSRADGEFSKEYKSDFENYLFKGQFPRWEPKDIDLSRVRGIFRVTKSEGGVGTGCTTGRVDWRARPR